MSLKPTKLTKTNVMQITCPLEKSRVILWDTELTGFGVSVTSRQGKDDDGKPSIIYNRKYIFNFRIDGKETRITLGKVSDHTNPTKMREMAEDIRRRAILGEEFRPKVRKQQVEEKRLRESVTVGDVMDAYIQWTSRTGKYSAKAIQNQLENYFKASFPKIWNKPARDFTPTDAKKIIDARSERSLHEANKIRTYMRTAYQMAIEAVASTDDVREFTPLGLDHTLINPVIQKPPKAIQTDRKRRITLSQIQTELQLYWQILDGDNLPRNVSQFLKFHLLTGGQRPAQLVRIAVDDIELEGERKHIRLERTKGRSAPKERDHIVPLTDKTAELMQLILHEPWNCEPQDLPAPTLPWTHPFSLKGNGHMEAGQLTRLYRTHIADKMTRLCKNEPALSKVEPFSLSAVRKSSTTFWRQSVPWHIEALLNDHGRSNDVQAGFYDQNDYFAEKLEALKIWESFILGSHS